MSVKMHYDQNEFMLQMGRTLRAWQNLESALFWVYFAWYKYNNRKIAFSLPDTEEAEMKFVFHATNEFTDLIHFSKKLNATNGVLEPLLTAEGKEEWKGLEGRLRRLSRQRNKFVHWQVCEYRIEDDEYIPVLTPPIGQMIMSGVFENEQAYKELHSSIIRLKDLVELQQRIHELTRALKAKFRGSRFLDKEKLWTSKGEVE